MAGNKKNVASGRSAFSSKIILRGIFSALFAIHPMHVESVAWVAEQKDLLYSIFYLLSLIYYIKYLRGGKTTIDNRPLTIESRSTAAVNNYRFYFISILFFILSLL